MVEKGNFLRGLIAVDIDDKKLELAKKFGATHTINSSKEHAVEKLKELLHFYFFVEKSSIM